LEKSKYPIAISLLKIYYCIMCAKINIEDSIIGCILGTAVGDSLGLSYEGLSAKRQARMFPKIESHNFLFGRGMASDDTEHTLMVGEALLKSGGHPDLFLRSLEWKFRNWFLGIPVGLGFATLRACLKLCIGFPGKRSGVFSAGNGPAMRSALIGVLLGGEDKLMSGLKSNISSNSSNGKNDESPKTNETEETGKDRHELMKKLVRASARITHTDPKAEWGSLAIALAAYKASRQAEEVNIEEYYKDLVLLLGEEGDEFLQLVKKAVDSFLAGKTTGEFSVEMGLEKGIGGYIYHTVPMVLHAWFCNPADYRTGVLSIIRCGGDTDTTAAILGAIIGSAVGEKGIPSDWIENLWEWPKTVHWMKRLGEKLAAQYEERKRNNKEDNFETDEGQKKISPPLYNPLLVYPRNFIFFLAVMTHGFRRLFPPY